jgi:hypothetical protein
MERPRGTGDGKKLFAGRVKAELDVFVVNCHSGGSVLFTFAPRFLQHSSSVVRTLSLTATSVPQKQLRPLIQSQDSEAYSSFSSPAQSVRIRRVKRKFLEKSP